MKFSSVQSRHSKNILAAPVSTAQRTSAPWPCSSPKTQQIIQIRGAWACPHKPESEKAKGFLLTSKKEQQLLLALGAVVIPMMFGLEIGQKTLDNVFSSKQNVRRVVIFHF